MPEAIVSGQTSGASPLEWQFQALVAVYNAIPTLPLALVFAYIGLVTGVVTGGVGWFLGAIAVFLTFAYLVFCIIIAIALWRHRSWARFAAIAIFVLYLLMHALLKASMPHGVPHSPQSPADHSLPSSVVRILTFMRFTLHLLYLLPFANVVALAHLLVRWKPFSRSAEPLR